MKVLLFLTMTLLTFFPSKTLSDQNIGTEDDPVTLKGTKCHREVLQFYGLEGLSEAQAPAKTDQDGALRFCPQISESCCSRDDFIVSQRLWNEDLLNIKGYLTKAFRIIQEINLLQSSLIQIAQQTSEGSHPDCKMVDITFFNPPFPFDEAYSYLTSAFQSMAYIQKGFYCTICDGDMQKYMMIPLEFSRLGLHISKKSCDDLVMRFKEYIMYKTYYLDSFYTNASRLFNCVNNDSIYNFTAEYQPQYQEIRRCVETGEKCELVCQEFRFGGYTELFMGDLSKYEAFHAHFIAFLEKVNVDHKRVTDQVLVPEYSMQCNDFFRPNYEKSDLEKDTVNVGRVSDMEVYVKDEGIDLFGTAQISGYFVSDQSSGLEKARLYNNLETNHPGSLLEKGVPETEAEREHYNQMAPDGLSVAQTQEDTKKMEALSMDNKPNDDQLNKLEQEIQMDEHERDDFRQKNGRLEDYDPKDEDPKFDEMQGFNGKSEDKFAGRLRASVMFGFLVYFFAK